MSDSARAISDNNATLTYLIHTCIMQYAQCIGLNPKKVQFRNAKLFAWNAKINPFFLACQEEVSWMLKKKDHSLVHAMYFALFLLFSAHSDVYIQHSSEIRGFYVSWNDLKKRFKVYHTFIRNVVLYSKIMVSQYHFIKFISLLFWSVSEYFYLATSST